MSPGRSLLANLLLSVVASALFLGGLEALARRLEEKRPPPPVADYIWDWDEKMPGDFYTLRSDATGWPPWEEINRDGLRDRTHPEEKPDGYWRLAVLGDSLTLGAETSASEAFPQVMESRLRAEGRRIQVMNVALWGWSTRQERLAYPRLLKKYRPDQVLLGVCLNDIPELQNNLTRPSSVLAALHRRSALVRRLVNAPAREIRGVEELFERPDSPKVRQAMDLFFSEVRALRDDLGADGARFAMAVFPFRFQLEPGAPAPRVQEEIASFCRAEKITCVDLLPALRKAGVKAFADYDHFSAAGSALVAETILESGLLPPDYSDPDVLDARLEDRKGPALQRALRDRDSQVRGAAGWALGTMGTEAEGAAPALVDALRKDDSEAVRAAAARALGAIGPRGGAVVPALFEALGDPSQNVRWAAAQALSRQELSAPKAVGPLTAALKSSDGYVRSFAAWTLGNMGPAAQAAVPALVEALREPEGYGRGGASAALAKMGPAASAAVAALIEGLKDPDGERRWKAARTLGRIGPPARAAVPALIEALKDPHDFVRAYAARSLGRIAPQEAAGALRGATRDPEGIVRKEAEDALARTR